MAFPFTFTYNKPLRTVINDDNRPKVFAYIQKRILEKSADNVLLDNDRVSYKGTTSNMRGAVFGGDSGVFTLEKINDRWLLIYRLDSRSSLIPAIIIAIVFSSTITLVGAGILAAIISFLWISGGNLAISLFQHEDVAYRIALGIDELFGDKELLAIEEKRRAEELKSWF